MIIGLSDYIKVSDETDRDGDVSITMESSEDERYVSDYLDKKGAAELIEHLSCVFNLGYEVKK